MSKPQVRKNAYKRLKQAVLARFSGNVFQRMSAKPEYKPLSADINLLGQQVAQYDEALAKAVNRGKDDITMKDQIRLDLLQTLDRLADQLNIRQTGNESWIINAGMEVKRSKVITNLDLEPPSDVEVQSRSISGEVVVKFNSKGPGRVHHHSVEYSLDGETWHSGAFGSATKIRLKGLPSRQDIQFRVCSLGAFQRKSPWSEPVMAFVL